MRTFFKWIKRLLVIPLLLLSALSIAIILITNIVTKPSNDRDWNTDQLILPFAEIQGDTVSIHNIRNFTYASTTSYTPHYYDKTYNLNDLQKVWYIVEPFSGIPGSAHTFLSFEFKNNEYVSISVEIRKEKGESFHPLKGLFNQYELMYVIADERDVIKLRTNYRKDQVYLYPVKTERVRELFLSMIERTNQLKENPEFYNSITNTCTTNIVRHIDTISPNRVPILSLEVLLPADSDKLAYDLGLLDTTLSFTEARQRFFVTEKAMMYADDPEFSIKIRGAK